MNVAGEIGTVHVLAVTYIKKYFSSVYDSLLVYKDLFLHLHEIVSPNTNTIFLINKN